MEIDITIKNYRCFPDSAPARISLRKGFTSLVGANNSGKSSLLKFFFELRSLFNSLRNMNGIHAALRNQQSFGIANTVLDLAELYSNSNNRDIEIRIHINALGDDGERITPPSPNALILKLLRPTNTFRIDLDVGNQALNLGQLRFHETVLLHGTQPVAELRHFIEAFKLMTETFYIGAFRNIINARPNEHYFDIQVGQSLIDLWRSIKTGPSIGSNTTAYNVTQDIKRIFEFNELEINPSADGQTLQLFINGRAFKLQEVGSGLTHFILTLVNVAIARPAYILIDEPELNLHPALQLDFLTTLASYAREGVLFTTQNIGLSRASAEKIFSVRKVGEGQSQVTELESTARLSELLGELSFSGHRELGFDKVLLVEGSTDVIAFQQLLRKYG